MERSMQRVTDQVDAAYLKLATPRPLPFLVVINLMGEHMFSRPQAFLDPWLILGLVGSIFFAAIRIPGPLLLIPLSLVLMRLAVGGYHLWRRVSDDLALLRKGLIIRAHVLRLRPHRTLTGEINGALLDCAIAVAPRRTYIGSVWLAEGHEALRLARQGRVEVICLPRTPGTWRLVEQVETEVRYDRMGPMAEIPHDDPVEK